MNEEWRNLLYPFGFLAQCIFGLRFTIQWFFAEKAQKSVTPPLFWKLSIFGSMLLYAHSLVQLHFPMCLAQSQNAVLAWRNLNLFGSNKSRLRFSSTILLLILAGAITVTFFALQTSDTSWIATPDTINLALGIHLFGIIGIACFALRFWVQWWQAERSLDGHLQESFWWISFFGSVVCCLYFFITNDWVNFIGPLVSLIPYGRNLYFIRRHRA